MSMSYSSTPRHVNLTKRPPNERTPLLFSNVISKSSSKDSVILIDDGKSLTALLEEQASKSKYTPSQMTLVKEYLVRLLAAVTFVWSLVSLILWPILMYPTVALASCIGIALAPYAIMEQHRLTQIEGLEHVNAQYCEQVNELQVENDRLGEHVQGLELSVRE
jgi:hypothetical protein